MVNNIKNNTISEPPAKQKLHALNKIKKEETKYRRLINGQKILLELFDDLVETAYFVKKENNNNVNVNKINDNVDNYFNIIDKTKSFEIKQKH